eukprot:scaffold240921_cov15-Prasinocladus_malaysianus.AAC.1
MPWLASSEQQIDDDFSANSCASPWHLAPLRVSSGGGKPVALRYIANRRSLLCRNGRLPTSSHEPVPLRCQW